MTDEKHLFASKTFWVSAATALLPILFPPAGVWIAANPELFSGLIGAAFAGLRVISDKKVRVAL